MSSRSINKVILIGYLGQDPEIRYMTNGGIITISNIATSDNWKDKKTGDVKEKTEWHRVIFFGKIAEIASEYLKKGSHIYIEGQLQTRKWKDQEGNEKYITEIIVGINGVMRLLNNSKNIVNNWNTSDTKNNNINNNNKNNGDNDFDIKDNFDDDDIPF